MQQQQVKNSTLVAPDRSPLLPAPPTLNHRMGSRDGRVRPLPQALVVAVGVAVACYMATTPSSAESDAGAAAASSCAAKLATCGGYLNATDTTPVPDSCCNPLKEVATTEAACVCSILMNKAALQAFGVTPEQGMHLAKLCGVTTDASTCSKYAAAGAGGTADSSGSTGTAASTVAKPTASGGTTRHLTLMAAPSLVALGFSFICWSIVA